MTQSRFLQVALEAAKEAEKVILKHYSPPIAVKFKKDNSPFTKADIDSEHVIIKTIKKEFPHHGFLGEESGSTSSESEYTWIIDPIDGTKNYIKGLPFFSTQIALMKRDKFIVGVSNAPLLNEMLYAEKGKGAFLNKNPVHVSSVNTLKDAEIHHGSIRYFKPIHKVENLIHLIFDTKRDRGFADFLTIHFLASGRCDIVVDAYVKIWDIAAVTAILEEAGGTITNLQGNPVTKDVTGVIATNGKLQNTVLHYFK